MTGVQPKLGAQSHWFIFSILAVTLLLPVVTSWIVTEYFYTDIVTHCDRDFWAVVSDRWLFSVLFFKETLLKNPLMWLLLAFSLAFMLFAFRQKFHLLRLRDFPGYSLLLPFFLLIVSSGLVYWQSLDIFTKGEIEQRLGDKGDRNVLFERNLDSLRIALDQQAGSVTGVQQLRDMADGLSFTGNMQYRMGSTNAGALFSEANSPLALFEGCRENVGIRVPMQNSSGFSEHKSVTVELFMPIEYERVTENHWSGRRLKYFHEVLHIGYLFGPMWWIYLLLLISPVWAFFIGFMLYRFRVLKIRSATQ
uniref:Uncharacterized protein n=1 Tax=Candidatus Kentrum sp. LPFa TaxID=2126335 RepID=A0A450WRX3_9GAMM|nr:MAG: hypothetical protein BECKLPF1236A_GA0070988_102373 [Candidatus Kentron sp. LPFa]VFK34033.1 MAG: hypothetical protein BECKLPF1236C_GA0070990_102393 [Candidatus Kentron sp. LPFa]